MSADVVIIGSGMAGLTCADLLRDAGVSVLVLDKGRGVGGRMATRRVSLPGAELRFDHGAQYLDEDGAELSSLFRRYPAAVGDWADERGITHVVGQAGMSSLPRAMADGLALRQGVEVTGLRQTAEGWAINTADDSFIAPHVVLTVPAPQAAALLADDPLADRVGTVAMAPSLVLMVAFPATSSRPFVSCRQSDAALAWIAQDSSKPGRPADAVTWVAHAGTEWSLAHLEHSKEEIAATMLPLLCEAIGARAGDALYTAAHRWRYAQVTKPLGQPFLRHPGGRLHLGGDWCLGAKVDHAVASGAAMARDILGQRDVG
jgi:renalase